MGPTCSIFFENEPEEKNIMRMPPRKTDVGLFERKELLISIVQGLIITAGVLALYFIFMNQGRTIEEVRTIVFATLLASNIFLTFTNRSFTENFLKTIQYRNKLAPIVLITSVMLLLSIYYVPSIRKLFELASLSTGEKLICLLTGFISVFWFELYKTNLRSIVATFQRNRTREISNT
jgi:Ca2+-transporting ATPase